MKRLFIAAACLLVAGWLSLRLSMGEPVAMARHPFFDGVLTPMVIAHRGASAERPEHTWAANDLAVEQGADMLELDVRMTEDGVLVVAHDRDLVRVAGVELQIATATLDEMRAAAGEKAPLPLADVLARYPLRFNIEIKEDRPEVAGPLVEILRATGRQNAVIVASVHARPVEAFRDLSKGEIATAAYGREALGFVLRYLLGIPAQPSYVSLQIPRRVSFFLDLGRRGLVEFAHRHGVAVYYWTIDEAAEMRELLDIGADGIMSNYPARLDRVRHASGKGAPRLP